MNRFFIKSSEFGTDAAAVLPGENKVIQVFIGNDGSRTIQVHPFNHGQALAETGLNNYSETTAEQLFEILFIEINELILSFLCAAFGVPKEQAMQLALIGSRAIKTATGD